MFELVTLYLHADYLTDPEYNDEGMIVKIKTDRDPEYSKELRDLIEVCVKPGASNRILLDHLRVLIRSYRDSIHAKYEQLDDDGKAGFRSHNRLYYIENDINGMPAGRWQRNCEAEDEKFADPWTINYPIFRDGPETSGKAGNDSDDDGAEAPDFLDLLFHPSHHHQPRRPRPAPPANLIADAVTPTRPHRLSEPVAPAGSTVDGCDIRSSRGARIGRRRVECTSSRDGGARDRNLSEGVKVSDGRLDGAVFWGAETGGGGVEGLRDGMTDDGSQDMDFGSDGSVSPPPRDSRISAPAPAQAHAPAPSATAPTLPPPPGPAQAPPRQAAAAAAPPVAQTIRPSPRRLRNGRVVEYV